MFTANTMASISEAIGLALTNSAMPPAVHKEERKDFEEGCEELFNLVRKKVITARIGQSFPLEKAVDAHHALERRQTKGSTILIP